MKRSYLIQRLGLTVGLSLLAMSPAFPQGLSCGATFGSPAGTPVVVTLNSDLGPCPGTALSVMGPNVTIRLNGYRIRGAPGAAVGIDVGRQGIPPTRGSDALITGPGRIEGFGRGVSVGYSHRVMIQKVVFVGNGTGISLHDESYDAVVRDNTITGGALGIEGLLHIWDLKIKKNTISGQTVAGIYFEGVDGVITQNVVRQAYEGFVMRASSHHRHLKITLNRFENNTLSGVRFFTSDNDTLQMEANQASGNGRDGFEFVSLLPLFPRRFEDNKAIGNRRYGIYLDVYSATNPPAAIDWSVIENEASGNVMGDLFFVKTNDGGGRTNTSCFKYNTFGVSNPATLPVCP